MTVQPFINKTPNYSVGTATATNGSVTVAFTGANLVQTDPTTGIVSSVCTAGDRFNVPGVGSATIQAIDPGGASLTLAEPWAAATQTNVAYTIYRYSTPTQGVVLAAANSAITQGQDANPVLSETVDDGTARFKMKNVAGTPTLAVGPTGTADAALLNAVQANPSTGAVSFPNGATPAGDWQKNRAINGGLDVWQGGTTFNVPASSVVYYTADQWPINSFAGVTTTVAKVAAPAGFSGQWAINAQATGVSAWSNLDFVMCFEGQLVADMAGKPSVLSFDVNASTTAGTLTGAIYFLCNTALDNGTFNAPGNSVGIPFTIPVGSGRVSVPFPVSQTANIGLGVQIYIRFWQQGATGNPNITIGAVQWEKGSVASPWSPKPIWEELAACQRYYQVGHSRFEGSGTYVGGYTRFNGYMRVSPTITLTDEVGTANACSTAVGGNNQPLPPVGTLASSENLGFLTDAIFATAPGSWCGFRWTASARL